jgi:hypothetical protein
VTHTAAFVIEGYYAKGPGLSFAIPTHKPIMILRDPPGGMSYATYENVKTTFKIETTHNSVDYSHRFGLGLKTKVGVSIPISLGFGGGILGAIFETEQDTLEIEKDVNVVKFGTEIGGLVHQSEEEKSNEFSTVWSYKTSEDPWLAGPMSDVFVVPNLNVMYLQVYEINWDDSENECTAIKSETTTFDLNADTTKNSMAFYSRYHVNYVKLPELRRKLEVKERKWKACKNKDHINTFCISKYNSVQLTKMKKEINVLKDGISGWDQALAIEDATLKELNAKKSILHWFDIAPDQSQLHEELKINDHSSSLASPSLIEKAEELENKAISEKVGKPKESYRLQFSGGGNTVEIQMKSEQVSNHLKNSCWNECNVHKETKIGLPSVTDFKALAFENGIGMDIDSGESTINVVHTSTKSTQHTESTTVGFVLGDADPQDEFVIDIYTDETYGSLIFDTVGGQSKCPHETDTAAVEDPNMKISKRPPHHVFPDDKMVFEVELTNFGVGEESSFVLYTKDTDNRYGLIMKLDGEPLVDSYEFTNVKKDVTFYKTITLERGSRRYRGGPIDLVFESACEDSSSLTNDLTASIFDKTKKSVTRKLWNVEHDGEKYLEFIEPCPEVRWAGSINRESGLVVNSETEDKENISITVFNPNRAAKSFKEMKKSSGRLEYVYLKYRELGTSRWNNGLTESDTNLDFASDDGDDYGYHTMTWNFVNPDGTYEIKVRTVCDELGGPEHLNMFDTPILQVVKDLTRPKQFGGALPLRDEIFIGEKMMVVFTEPLHCERPLSFDMELDIHGTDDKFQRDDLQVVCEGRKISFQIDLTKVNNVEHILGKDFTVEIGRIGTDSESDIMDRNGNGMDPNNRNVKFEKKFAPLNLDEASTSFVFSYEHDSSDDMLLSTKNTIAKLLKLPDTSRIEMSNLDVDSSRLLSVRVKLQPVTSTNHNRSLRLDGDGIENHPHSLALFYQLRGALEDIETQHERKLGLDVFLPDDYHHHDDNGTEIYTRLSDSQISFSEMEILPSVNDMERFKGHGEHPDDVEMTMFSNKKGYLDDSSPSIAGIKSGASGDEKLMLEKVLAEGREREQKVLAEGREREQIMLGEINEMHREFSVVILVCFGFSFTLFFFFYLRKP